MRNLIAILIAFLSLAASARTVDEVPNVHAADSTRFVSDPDSHLSRAAIARADSILGSVWRSTTAEPVAVIVSDLGGADIDNYATDLFEAWGIGKKIPTTASSYLSRLMTAKPPSAQAAAWK